MRNEPPIEVKSLIDPVLTGFDNKDTTMYSSAFGNEVVIVDGMAPYRWTGANAQGRWFADAEKWAHELGLTNEKIANERIVHADVVGMHATCSFPRLFPSYSRASLTVATESSPLLSGR